MLETQKISKTKLLGFRQSLLIEYQYKDTMLITNSKETLVMQLIKNFIEEFGRFLLENDFERIRSRNLHSVRLLNCCYIENKKFLDPVK
jgi:hypothetical protein